MHAGAGTPALEWNAEMLPRGFGGFQNASVFSRVCSPPLLFLVLSFELHSWCTRKKKSKQTHISSAEEAFGTPLLGSFYLSDFDFSSTVPFAFLAGHLENQRDNYFSAFCWDGGISLLWNAACLANGVTQDGWTEAVGMKRIDGEEEKW